MTEQKQVIIVAKGPTNTQCPYDCETWTPDRGWLYAKRIDKTFCMGEWKSLRDLVEAKQKFGFTIVASMQPNGFAVELYPIIDILQKWAPLAATTSRSEPKRLGFFGNDIAYMIAYAILKEYTKIRLYGIDILNSETFLSEKGSMEYWLGVALGRGIEIWNAPGSVVGRTHNGRMYGFWGDKEQRIKEIVREFNI